MPLPQHALSYRGSSCSGNLHLSETCSLLRHVTFATALAAAALPPASCNKALLLENASRFLFENLSCHTYALLSVVANATQCKWAEASMPAGSRSFIATLTYAVGLYACQVQLARHLFPLRPAPPFCKQRCEYMTMHPMYRQKARCSCSPFPNVPLGGAFLDNLHAPDALHL